MAVAFSWLVFAFITLFANEARQAPPEIPPERSPPGMANENPLTSHILDTTLGKPAADVRTVLSKYNDVTKQFDQISEQRTSTDGRVGNIIPSDLFTLGVYKIFFDTKPYFDQMGVETFYPYVEIVFEVKDALQHYHVPLLLNPFGYSTYRGS